ncbi:SH3 domain-binding protein 2-like isoform X2 [Pomacea canaliculata]|nr:SH3 domain-binding protein 2-like isoform X2 [Pomacea canaliculata]
MHSNLLWALSPNANTIMSNTSATRVITPHKTIGAQELISGPHDRSGFLRKRGQKERLFENLKLSKHVNWRQRFVVVSDCCCYCYDDELAKEPLQCFSLAGYNRVYRTTSERNPFCFMVEPINRWQEKLHIFSCSSEDDRKLWMQAFKGAMVEANDAKNSSKGESGDSDEFKDIEKPIFETEDNHLSQTTVSLHDDSGGDAVDSDTDSDYDRVDEDLLQQQQQVFPPQRLRKVPLPPIPQGDVSPRAHTSPIEPSPPPRVNKNKPRTGPRHDVAPPIPAAKPQVSPEKPRRLSERDSLFDDSDREKAIAILREKKALGTFLIRKSRQGDSRVLAVMTAEDVKEYKIFEEGNRVTLDRKQFFRDVDELLDTYSREPLPNRQQTLTRSFSSATCNPRHPKSPS